MLLQKIICTNWNNPCRKWNDPKAVLVTKHLPNTPNRVKIVHDIVLCLCKALMLNIQLFCWCQSSVTKKCISKHTISCIEVISFVLIQETIQKIDQNIYPHKNLKRKH